MTDEVESPPQARFDVSFIIGPCSDADAEKLSEAIIDLPEFKAVGGGAVGAEKLMCVCGTPLIVCECGDDRCPKCDPGERCPGA